CRDRNIHLQLGPIQNRATELDVAAAQFPSATGNLHAGIADLHYRIQVLHAERYILARERKFFEPNLTVNIRTPECASCIYVQGNVASGSQVRAEHLHQSHTDATV